MRSSKSRSRSKSNRPRSMGNIVNRVFDSSGPEGKVRGTPQQIIEKYQILARDAQLSNDRVAEQNFFQHAEHYARMLSEAQREMAREQENRRDQNDGNQNAGNQNSGNQNNGNQNNAQGGGQNNNRRDRDAGRDNDRASSQGAEVMDVAEGDSGLVETPEERKTRAPVFRTEDAPAQEAAPEAAEATPAEQPAEAAEKPAKPRRPRAPRKPRKAVEGEASEKSSKKSSDKAEGAANQSAEQSPAAE